MDAGDYYTKEMGQYPVIYLTLKSAKQSAWEQSYAILKEKIAAEFKRHRSALDALPLLDGDRGRVDRVMNQRGELEDYLTALQFLSGCLEQYYRKKVVILIDEYDVPLKSNESLAFAVLTGCLRITKESIFTGLNNLKVMSVRSGLYAEYFGFTQREVDEMLKVYGCESSCGEVRAWYDGYLFGESEVYNPWREKQSLRRDASEPLRRSGKKGIGKSCWKTVMTRW